MKKLFIFAWGIFLSFTALGQNMEDAVRFSNKIGLGSARVSAMNGAFTALGGDPSSISINPAGIGVFRKSEISITPFIANYSVSSFTKADNTQFRLGELSTVFSYFPPGKYWKNINFGFNYIRLNNFKQNIHQAALNSEKSMTDVFAAQGYEFNGNEVFIIPSDKLPEFAKLAWETYLINSNEKGYYSAISYIDKEGNIIGEPVNIYKSTYQEGWSSEYNFSVGANYRDKFYIGACLGIQDIDFEENIDYREIGNADVEKSGFDQFVLDQYRSIRGVGANLKLGMIYRPIPEIRIGFSIHTPTYYNMNYEAKNGIKSWFKKIENNVEKTVFRDKAAELQEYEFDMTTPWRINLGLATVIEQRAIVSLDYGYAEYSGIRFKNASDNYNYHVENNDLKHGLTGVHHLNFGTEFRLTSVFSLRAGYGLISTPYKTEKNENNYNVRQSIAAGFGINFGSFYMDMAYMYKFMKDQSVFFSYTDPKDSAYDIYSPIVENKHRDKSAKITFGFRF